MTGRIAALLLCFCAATVSAKNVALLIAVGQFKDPQLKTNQLLGPPHDIHSQQGIDAPALELVLFGKNTMTIPRNYYDPETGKVRTALPQ